MAPQLPQPLQPVLQPQNQHVPITFPNTTNTNNLQFKLVSQCCGITVSSFFAVFSLLTVIYEIRNALKNHSISIRLTHWAYAFAAAFYLYFFVKMVHVPEFLAGKPEIKRFWAPIANFSTHLITVFCVGITAPVPEITFDVLGLLSFVACLAIYSQDDAKESFLLCFKPWVYKKVQVEIVHVQATTPITNSAYPTVSFTYPGYNYYSQNQPIIK